MHHPLIIGLTGPAGSGKDTAADLLVEHAGFTKLAFADTLKSEVADAFAVDLEYLTRRETKEHPMSCLAMSRCLADSFVGRMMTLHSQGSAPLDLDAPHSPRQIMQWWGTEYRRRQQPGYWVSKTRNRISYLLRERLASRIVVTDCRFADEVEMVRSSFGGQLWAIKRAGVSVAQGGHPSETTGLEFAPDVVINNSYEVAQLQERVLEAHWSHSAGLKPGTLHVRIGKPYQAKQAA
jgi:hypothetical protein